MSKTLDELRVDIWTNINRDWKLRVHVQERRNARLGGPTEGSGGKSEGAAALTCVVGAKFVAA